MDPGLRALLRYVVVIAAIELLLVAAYVVFPGVTLLDLDKEYNLPAWFSALQLAAIGAAALFAFEAERATGRPSTGSHWVWPVLTVGFFYLSADEALALHERVFTDLVRHMLPADSLLQAVLPWQLVFAPAIFGAFIVVSAMLYSRLGSRPGLRPLGFSGLGLWAISLVLEGAAKPLFIPAKLYRLEVALEESAEMLGATCILLAFAAYAAARLQGLPTATEPVPWRRVFAAAGGLSVTVAAAITVLTASNPAYLYRRAGDTFVKKGEYARATVAYSRAVTMRPDDADLRRRLARATLRAKEYVEAAKAYREAIALSPRDPVLHADLGVALHYVGDLAGAIAASEAALRINPDYARAHKNLAVALETSGDLERAEAHYRLAIEHDGRMADAHRYLGDLLRRRGRLREAREHWQRSLEVDPRQEHAVSLRRLISEADRADGSSR